MTQPPGRLAGQVAIITGASTGIGAGIAARFLSEGASVGLMSRRADRLATTVASLAAPDRVLALAGDVTNRGDVQRLVDTTRSRFGRLDVIVSNAGIQRLGSFLELEPEAWREIIEVNLHGTFNACQIGARALVEQGSGGAIVVVASTNSFVAEPSMSAYNASKGALPVMVQSMAIELARYRIRVNAVAPGTIESEMTRPMIEAGFPFGGIPLDRLGTPDDIAWPVLFLASSEAAYITGATLVVDGGQLAINGGVPDDPEPG